VYPLNCVTMGFTPTVLEPCGTIGPLCTLAKGLTLAGIGTLLTLVALGASFISARREMRVDPIVALRHE
jgi:hypothetical protein